MEEETILEMRGITKDFPGVRALDNVDFELRRGEIHALVGKNGAGKSTLIKILAGIYPKDGGRIFLKGREVDIYDALIARKMGFSFVHQHPETVSYFNVLENMFLGNEVTWSRLGFVNKAKMRRQAEKTFHQLGIELDLQANIGELTSCQKQLVMIARGLVLQAEVFVLDEPTAALSRTEIFGLFQGIRSLRKLGVAIIYVSHYLSELFEIADRVTVMRNGEKIGTYPIKEIDTDRIIALMIGKKLKEQFPKEKISKGKKILELKNLTRKGAVENVSFSLHQGEIVGITGVIGAGKTELARLLFGIDRPDEGEIWLDRKKVEVNSPSKAKKLGIVLTPEERREEGLVLDKVVRENCTMPYLDKWCRFGIINLRDETKTSNTIISDLSIQTTGPEQVTRYLSGGNQEKLSLGKWLSVFAKVFVLDEPTVGIDVEAKTEIYRLTQSLAKQGAGCIFISSEPEEIMGVCDRVLVMCKCRIVMDSRVKETTLEEILFHMIGK